MARLKNPLHFHLMYIVYMFAVVFGIRLSISGYTSQLIKTATSCQ